MFKFYIYKVKPRYIGFPCYKMIYTNKNGEEITYWEGIAKEGEEGLEDPVEIDAKDVPSHFVTKLLKEGVAKLVEPN